MKFVLAHRQAAIMVGILSLVGMLLSPVIVRLNRRLLIQDYRRSHWLACEGSVLDAGRTYNILVFQCNFQGWPGEMSQDVVVTDSTYQVVAVHPSVHESMFVSANVSTIGGRDSLEIRRSIRPGFQQEVAFYECRGGRLQEVSRVLDPPEIQLPPQIDLRELSRRAHSTTARR